MLVTHLTYIYEDENEHDIQVQVHSLRRSFDCSHVKNQLFQLYTNARDLPHNEIISDNNELSILIIHHDYYVVTNVTLPESRRCSEQKVIIPIIAMGEGIKLQFSNLKALSIVSRECLGQRCSDAQDYNIIPILPRITMSDFYKCYVRKILDNGEPTLGVTLPCLFEIMLASARSLKDVHETSRAYGRIRSSNMLLTRIQGSFNVTFIASDDKRPCQVKDLQQGNNNSRFYNAPELLNNNRVQQISFASDVYALGFTFIELLMSGIDEKDIDAGIAPWARKSSWNIPTRQEKLVATLNRWICFYRLLLESAKLLNHTFVFSRLRTLLKAMLEENLDKRISLSEVVRGLEWLVDNSQVFGLATFVEPFSCFKAPMANDLVVLERNIHKHTLVVAW